MKNNTTTVFVNYIQHTSDDFAHCEWLIMLPTKQLYDEVQRVSEIVSSNNLYDASPDFMDIQDIRANSYWLCDFEKENKHIEGYESLTEMFDKIRIETGSNYFMMELSEQQLVIITQFDSENCYLIVTKDCFSLRMETDFDWFETEDITTQYLEQNKTKFLTSTSQL